MKTAIASLFCALSLHAADITLLWDYPDELDANLTFKIYSSPNVSLPLSNWNVVPITGTTTVAKVTMSPQRMFFFVTASNFWGESGPSNTNMTPKPATNTANLKLAR